MGAFLSTRPIDSPSSLTPILPHLKGSSHRCARYCPGRPVTYWTHNLDEHLVRDATSQEPSTSPVNHCSNIRVQDMCIHRNRYPDVCRTCT
ncbi:DUF7558 family protein [Halocatena salina]|uniref:DUF7558 family protein n=1 Tax=Halocatena salina TaxID=2934340 RepID=UPI003F622C82